MWVLDFQVLGAWDFQSHLIGAGIAIPIIFITADGDIRTAVKAMKAGAVDFLIKPFSDNALLDAIEQQFGFRVDVIVRTPTELRDAIARNPFGKRPNLDAGKLLITFLASEPNPEARNQVLKISSSSANSRSTWRI